jgi:hypothetical protein
VIRVIRAKLRIDQNEFESEVMKQLKHFKPDADEIKKRIEDLIKQEFLEIGESDTRLYQYVP